jgi:hypothetical protein
MAISLESLKSDLYDMLESRGYDPKGLDSTGKETPNPEKSDVIRFELKDQNGISAGQGWIGVELKKNRAEDKKNIVLWIDPKLMKSPEFETFFNFLRGWKRDKGAGFELKTNKGQLVHDMKKRTIMKEKEKLEEGYYPLGKKSSYSDNVPTVKIILQHTRQLEEGEQRFRNIARIFVENAHGERFLIPTNRPGLARVFARHIAEGGTPYDDKAKHISTLVEEYTKMAGFVRATKNGQFNESAQRLVNEGVSHYQNLRETLSRMTTHKGYVKYFESYTPVLNEESDENSLNELFVRETLDPRIESVLPILSRLSKNLNEMNEVKELDKWAQSLIEGGDGGEASEETDGDTAGNAGEGGAEDVTPTNEQTIQHRFIDQDGNEYDEVEVKKPLSTKREIQYVPKQKSEPKSEPDSEKKEPPKKPHIPGPKERYAEAEEVSQKKMADTNEVAEVIFQSLKGEKGLNSNDIYSIIDEYESLMDDEGYEVATDDVAQILMDKLNITNETKLDNTTKSLAVPADKMLDEAPGSETLKHNQNTVKSNLDAFDLDEDFRYYYPGATKASIKKKAKGLHHGIKEAGDLDENTPVQAPATNNANQVSPLQQRHMDRLAAKQQEYRQKEDAKAVEWLKSKGVSDANLGKYMATPQRESYMGEGSADLPIEKMSNKDLADYLGVSVKFVTQNRKQAEQAARDKTDDNLGESSLPGLQTLPYKIKPNDGTPKIKNLPYEIKPSDGTPKIKNLPYKLPAGEYKKIKEQDEGYREISNLNDFKTGTVGSVVQYTDGKFGFKYGDKLSPQKFTSRRDADNALYAHHKRGVAEDIDNLNTAQQSAQMQKQGGELKIPKQDFDSMSKDYAVDKGMQKDIKASTDKEGNIDATKLLSKGVDRMMPAMGGAVRDLNKVYYRDMPGKLQADQKRNPEEFKKQYDALDPESKAEVDRQLAITPAQAKANYKAQQGAADKQMADMGYSKYGYNYNSQPVVGRIKNAGAWVKDKFNEEDEEVSEDLDANQKRAGQLGPTEPVGKNERNLRGKLVGASESTNYDEHKLLLDRITKLAGK